MNFENNDPRVRSFSKAIYLRLPESRHLSKVVKARAYVQTLKKKLRMQTPRGFSRHESGAISSRFDSICARRNSAARIANELNFQG